MPELLGRRGLLLAGGAAAVAGVVAMRPSDHGAGGHDAYFAGIASALRAAEIAHPVLVIDRTRLAQNIAVVKAAIDPARHATRVVAKSLPSPRLLEAVMQGVGTRRAMVFSVASLEQVAALMPDADLLFGKPVPALEVAGFVRRHGNDSSPAAAPQFLADSGERLAGLIAIARGTRRRLRVNFEIDVGLHRGGFPDAATLASALDQLHGEALIEPSGLMGYDPHVAKVPFAASAYATVLRRYGDAVDVLREKLGADPATLTLNTAGSPTYHLHLDETVSNELALGSGFVKPGDFDLPSLSAHVPAAFIATPVIKAAGPTRVPGLEALAPALRFWDRNSAQAFFIHGGHWLAKPVSPPGLQYSAIFGRSSNQEMLTGSERVRLSVDDYIFLRPDQSEAVFLQFGDLAIYDRGAITDRWPTFPVSA